MQKFTRSIIIGGLTIAGAATAVYRAYKLKKLREELKEQEIIDIDPVLESETPQK